MPLHSTSPVWQVSLHAPETHRFPAGQACPQVPQLEGSLDRSTQLPLQQSSSVLQEVVQFPQWFVSALVSTQVPLQQAPEQQSEF